MHNRIPAVAALVLLTVSCSLYPPASDATLDRMAHETSTAGPSAVEFVEARFHQHHARLSPQESRDVSETIVRESQDNQVPWDLVLAVIQTESGYFNFAVSHVGALGLMQIMPATGAHLAAKQDLPWKGAETTLFEPVENVQMGVRYLSELHDRYDDWDRALAAYNWGPGRIDSRIRRGVAVPVGYVQAVRSRVLKPL